MNDRVFEALADAQRREEPVALGIITGVKGSSPQKLGAKAVFYRDGRIVGTMGGGCLEAEIQRRAVQSIVAGKATRFELVLDHDFGWDDGLICGGKVAGLILPGAQARGGEFWSRLAGRRETVDWGVRNDYAIELLPGSLAPALRGDWLYQERVRPRCPLWIAGAGHIAQAVAPLALQVDFDVTVLDDRPALASHSYFPQAVRLEADTWDRLLSLSPRFSPSFALVVTRGHRHDALVLQTWIHRPFVFIGMIGSSRKARTIFEHFRDEKIATAEELGRVACPVGIRIRSRTVQEIAISIIAQFIDKRGELATEPDVLGDAP